MTAYKVRYCP